MSLDDSRAPTAKDTPPAEEPLVLQAVSLRQHSHRTVVADDIQHPISPSTHVHWLDWVLHGGVLHLTTSVDHLQGQPLLLRSVNGFH